MQRLKKVWSSFRTLPLWVQIWVGLILVLANTLPFFFLNTPTGRWASIAAVFVVLTNVPIMLIKCGMSRLMTMPHLLAWGDIGSGTLAASWQFTYWNRTARIL